MESTLQFNVCNYQRAEMQRKAVSSVVASASFNSRWVYLIRLVVFLNFDGDCYLSRDSTSDLLNINKQMSIFVRSGLASHCDFVLQNMITVSHAHADCVQHTKM